MRNLIQWSEIAQKAARYIEYCSKTKQRLRVGFENYC